MNYVILEVKFSREMFGFEAFDVCGQFTFIET